MSEEKSPNVRGQEMDSRFWDQNPRGVRIRLAIGPALWAEFEETAKVAGYSDVIAFYRLCANLGLRKYRQDNGMS